MVDKGVLLFRQNPLPAIGERYKEDALKSPIWRDHKALGLIKEGLCNYLNSINKPIPESDTAAFHLLLAMTKSADAGDFINIFTFNFTPPDIVTALKDADEVIIFGHSLGENDRQYFAPFFLKQADYDNPERKDITIFTRDDYSKIEIKRALQKMTDGKLSALYSINQPIIIRTKNLQEDQKLMYDFLLKHHTRDHYAMEVIGKLLKKKDS